MQQETQPREALWAHCKSFIEKQGIGCGETVYQTDRVIENALQFIEGVCEIVGYFEEDAEAAQ